MSMNRDAAIAQDPYKKTVYFLSFMRGSKTKGWARAQYNYIEQVEDDPSLLPWSKTIWQVVKQNFKQTFVDYAVREKAQDKLHKLKMKEGNIDQYIADFQLVTLDTRVDLNEPTVVEIFKQGLPLALADKVIESGTAKDFESWAKEAQ
jgi:hypothetical protein